MSSRDDPLLDDPDLEGVDFDDPHIQLAQKMASAGIHLCLIYAYLNTGLIVTRANASSLPDEVLVQWEVALEDYEEDAGEPAPQREFDDEDLDALGEPLGPGDLWDRWN